MFSKTLFRGRRPLFIVAGLIAMLTIATTADAASWSLVDNHQDPCFSHNATSNYYGIWLDGTWTHAVSVSITGLPSGSTAWTFESPVPPGSSDGQGSVAYVGVKIPSSTAVGAHTAQLHASDGSSSQQVEVGLNVQASCRY